MKKLLIYRKNTDTNRNELLRSVNVFYTFIGIGRWGQINQAEFKSLAEDLEPTSTSFSVIDI